MELLAFPIAGFAVACVARLIRPLATITSFARLAARTMSAATMGGVSALAFLGDGTTVHDRVSAADLVWLLAVITAPLILAIVHDAAFGRHEVLPPLVGQHWRWHGDETDSFH